MSRMTVAPTTESAPAARRRRLAPSSSLLRFVLRRLGAFVLLMLGISFVAFVLTELVPSNAAATNLGEQAAADPEAVKAFEEHYGLDKPLPVRYLIYLKHLVHGDLGQSSLTHQAVTHDLGTFIPATAELALYSILFAALVGVTFGVVAALRRNRPADHALRVASLAGISMPTFWIALVVLYVGFYRLGWFPGGQRLDPGTTPPPSVTGMYTVDALLDGNLGLFGTAFHHLLLPVLGLVFANVLTGAVLVEKIFSWPGVGQYAYQAAVNVDVAATGGVSLFVAAVYVTVNFVVDILYGIIDPRIRVA